MTTADIDSPLDESLTTLLPALVASDPAIAARLRTRVLELIDAAVDQILEDMEEGDTATRSLLAKQILPVLFRAQRDTGADAGEDAAEVMEQARGMIAAMGQSMPGATEP